MTERTYKKDLDIINVVSIISQRGSRCYWLNRVPASHLYPPPAVPLFLKMYSPLRGSGAVVEF